MKTAVGFLFAALVASTFAQDESISTVVDPDEPTAITHTVFTGTGDVPPFTPTRTGCPTITETASICSTCVLLACLAIETQIQRCGCPAEISTATITYGCETACGDMGISCMGTSYVIMTEECATSPETPTNMETVPTSVEGETGDDDDGGTPTNTEESTTGTTLANDGAVTVNAAAGRFKPFLMW